MPDDPQHCEKCGADLSASRVASRCPRCLLADALSTSSGDIGPGVVTIDMVRDAFPRYDVEGLLGQGGMASVFRAKEKDGGRQVALKVLSPEAGADPSFSSRFTREAETLAGLDHPNIVALYNFGEAEGIYFLAMELVEGETLARRHVDPDGAVAIVTQICRALECAHAHGVVHRDIKPANILVTPDGTAKVADFGLAKLLHEDPTLRHPTLTSAGYGVGTPLYMAPEQREDEDNIDHRADIYSLGVVLYELLTGVLPAGHFLPPSKKANSGKGIDRVVRRALASEPEQRFQSAEAMRLALSPKKPALWRWAAAAALVAGLIFAATRSGPAEFNHPSPAGKLVAWGSNLFGDLNVIPDDVGDVVAIAQRGFLTTHTLALRSDGTVIAWGLNTHGQCDVPEDLDGVVAIDAGYRFSLALRDDGTLASWGAKYGIPKEPLADIAAISANGVHALALKTDGTLVSWGLIWFSGLKVPPIEEKVIAVGSGLKHRVAITESGEIIAWGSNEYGQCDVPELDGRAVAVSCGIYHSLALTDDGRVIAWGLGTNGQTQCPEGSDFVQISACGNTSAALGRDGSIEVWGWHQHAAPTGRNDFTAITAGFLGGYAITKRGDASTPPPAPVELGEGESFARHSRQINTIAKWGKHVYTLSADGVRMVSEQPESAPEPLWDEDATAAATSRNGNRFAILSDQRILLGSVFAPADEIVIGGSFSSIAVDDNGQVAVGGRSGDVLHVPSGTTFHADAPIQALGFQNDQSLAVAAGDWVILFDVSPTGLSEHARFRNHATTHHLDVAADGTIAVTSGMGGIGILNSDSLAERAAWLAHLIDGKNDLPGIIATGRVDLDVPVAISPDGKRLATVGPDRMVRLWDAGSGLLLANAGPLKNAAASIVLTPEAIIVPDGKALRHWPVEDL